MYYAQGGGTTGSFQVSNSNFYGNLVNDQNATAATEADGGAIYVSDSSSYAASILSSTFNGNVAQGSNHGGGGFGGGSTSPATRRR